MAEAARARGGEVGPTQMGEIDYANQAIKAMLDQLLG